MTVSKSTIKNIIKKLLRGEDYRIEIVALINSEFLQFAVDFFKRIVNAKLSNKNIDIDWYKEEFLNEKLPPDEIAIHAGLNKKTIANMFNSTKKEIVLNASIEHYDQLCRTIDDLTDKDLNLLLTIKFKEVSVQLNLNESLIIINTLAVKRAALRGSYWSLAGKRVEKALMETLCLLFEVPPTHYHSQGKGPSSKNDFAREIDFYLGSKNNTYKCEVKLMGKGNPESADAVIARESKVFIADKLSDTNKKQLDSLNVHWVELRSTNGFLKFAQILEALDIPHTAIDSADDEEIDFIIEQIV